MAMLNPAVAGWDLPGAQNATSAPVIAGWSLPGSVVADTAVAMSTMDAATDQPSGGEHHSHQGSHDLGSIRAPMTLAVADVELSVIEDMFGTDCQLTCDVGLANNVNASLSNASSCVDFATSSSCRKPEPTAADLAAASRSVEKRKLPDPLPRRLVLRPKCVQYMYPPLQPAPLLGDFPWETEFHRVTEPARRATFSRGFTRKVLHASLFVGTFSEDPGFEALGLHPDTDTRPYIVCEISNYSRLSLMFGHHFAI